MKIAKNLPKLKERVAQQDALIKEFFTNVFLTRGLGAKEFMREIVIPANREIRKEQFKKTFRYFLLPYKWALRVFICIMIGKSIWYGTLFVIGGDDKYTAFFSTNGMRDLLYGEQADIWFAEGGIWGKAKPTGDSAVIAKDAVIFKNP